MRIQIRFAFLSFLSLFLHHFFELFFAEWGDIYFSTAFNSLEALGVGNLFSCEG